MHGARIRLASLWVSQCARVLADNCLRMFVVVQAAQAGIKESEAAWHQVTPFFILPFIVLAPLNGALCNGLPRRWVLAGSSLYCFAVTLASGFVVGAGGDAWLWCGWVGLVMIGGAIYSPARYALLPAAASDARVPLARVTGWIEMGGAAASVAGFLLGLGLHGLSWPQLASDTGMSYPDLGAFPPAVAVAVLVNLVGFLAALPVHFASDVRRPEPVVQAVAGFFRDCRRIARDREARSSLLGLAGFLGLVVTGSGTILSLQLSPLSLQYSAQKEVLAQILLLAGLGVAAGSLLAGVQGHPRRSLGLVPLGATGMVLALAWGSLSQAMIGPCLALGVMGGLINVPLRAAYQGWVPADARGNGMAVMNTVYYLLVTAMAVTCFGLTRLEVLSGIGQFWLLAGLAALGAAVAWWALFRETLEQMIELFFWPAYRVRGHGPGLPLVPHRGPLLILANHTAWLDPMWLARAMPRRLIPMMTSDFFDLPVMRWFMVHVFHAIRVQSSRFRREAPELQQAIAALDRGECVCIFPEGWMRRSPEATVRQFGRGIWHILRERPDTPVIACWIEGGWGSYTSFCGGPPTVNKWPDWWRRINVAVSEPQVLPREVLDDHRATRAHLRHACLEARRILGLEAPAEEETEEPEAESALAEEPTNDE